MAGTNGFSIAGDKFEGFKCCGNDALHFKLVRHESDLTDDSKTFKPEMTHQLFGEHESIFGYKDLRVEVYCLAAHMKTYVSVKYSDKITPELYDGVAADDILKTLKEQLQPGFMTNVDEFTSALAKDVTFKPYGRLIHSYTVSNEGQDRQFEIYKTDIEEPGFRDYHERLQPFLMFYVDAASYIDVDDDRWMYYLTFEKYVEDGRTMYAFVGYMTVYNYYAYPEKIRPRVSQVLVLPPYQRQGHGAVAMQTFYNDCSSRSEVLDITVEDPSENFQRVRDFVDGKNCSKLPSYQPEKLREGFSDEMVTEAREKLRINRKQARRIYEILRLKATDCSKEPEYRAYRLDIKKRLNLPFQKNGRDFAKLRKALQPNELAATINNITIEQRIDFLEKEFQESVTDYRTVIERLARD